MFGIQSNYENEIVIKKSRFIACLFPMQEEQELESFLNVCKEKYPNATHYCYGYILNPGKKKASDDKEPNKTAGLPILNVLEKQNLQHILCVVVRYFGGIKLGSGGLIRAYQKSVQEALKNAKIMEQVEGYQIEIKIPYEKQKTVDYLLAQENIVARSFQEEVILIANIHKKTEELLKEAKVPYQIIKNIIIEKEFKQ